MSVIYYLIPVSLVFLGVAVWFLIWAIRSGQYEDMDSHGWRILVEDDRAPPPHRDRPPDT